MRRIININEQMHQRFEMSQADATVPMAEVVNDTIRYDFPLATVASTEHRTMVEARSESTSYIFNFFNIVLPAPTAQGSMLNNSVSPVATISESMSNNIVSPVPLTPGSIFIEYIDDESDEDVETRELDNMPPIRSGEVTPAPRYNFDLNYYFDIRATMILWGHSLMITSLGMEPDFTRDKMGPALFFSGLCLTAAGFAKPSRQTITNEQDVQNKRKPRNFS